MTARANSTRADVAESFARRVAGFLLTTSRRSPWLPVVTAAVVAWIVTRPWGNYGLNDDWVYAHVAKNFAETGGIHLNLPTAASALGPALLAYPILKIFGFSHLYLRFSGVHMPLLLQRQID